MEMAVWVLIIAGLTWLGDRTIDAEGPRSTVLAYGMLLLFAAFQLGRSFVLSWSS